MANEQRDLLMAYVDAYNRADWRDLAVHVSPGYVHRSGEQVRDLDGFIEGSKWLRKGFPDFVVEVQDMVSEGDRTAVRFVARGTHLDSLLGEEPTHREVVLDGTTIFRFENGVIVEDWEMMDEGQLRRQIGW
jgi:predicted ester cyclase